MILERLDLIAFGRFSGESIDLSAGPTRFHLVYGPNESGKSTSLRAIHSLLFGIPERTEDNFLHPNTAMRIGARIVDPATGRGIECVRRKGRRNTLTSPDAEKVDAAKLAELLRGVDSETFSRRFGLTHEELVAGGRAILEGNGDLGEMLFAAGAGAGTLQSACRGLEKDLRELFVPRGSSGTLNQLLAQHRDNEKRLRELRLLPVTYDAKHREYDAAVAEADELSCRVAEQAASLRRLRNYLAVSALLPQRTAILEQLETIGDDVPLLDDAFSTRRRELDGRLSAVRSQLKTQREQLAELIRRRDEETVDAAWLDAAPVVQTLMNQLSAVEAAESELAETRREANDIRRKIEEAEARLGMQGFETRQQSEAAPEDSRKKGVRPLLPGTGPPGASHKRGRTPFFRGILSDVQREEIHELITRHAGLTQKLQTAETTEAGRERELARIDAALNELPADIDPSPLADAIGATERPERLLEHAAACAAELAKAQRRVDKALAKLRGFAGDADHARRLALPAASEIDAATSRIAAAKDDLQAVDVELKAAEGRLREATDVCEQEVAEADLPTTADRDRIRSERDSTIAALREAVTAGKPVRPALVDRIDAAVRVADRISDRLLEAHDRVVRRDRVQEDVRRAEAGIEKIRCRRSEVVAAVDGAEAAWRELWQSIDVAPGDPGAMRRWVADHESLLELISQAEDEAAALDEARDRIERACRHLETVLRLSGSDEADSLLEDDAGSRLIALHALVSRRQEELSSRRAERRKLDEERKRVAGELQSAKENHEKERGEHDRWQQRWDELTRVISCGEQPRPETVAATLRTIDSLQTLVGQLSEASAKSERLQSAKCDYLGRVAQAARRLSLEFSEPKYAELVREMARGCETHARRHARRETLGGQIEGLEEKLAEAERLEETVSAQLKQLCIEAGCDSVERLPEIEQASACRRDLEKELRAIDQQVRTLAESDSPEEFLRAAAARDPAELEVAIETAESEQSRLRTRWTEAQQQVGLLRGQVEAMDSGDEAARLQQEQQNLSAAIRRHADRYAELTIASEILRRAIEHYREQNEGPMLRRASAFFQRMTGGRYETLRVDFDDRDQPRLCGVLAGGDAVPANRMSDGTADALYLSLRLAGLEVHLDAHAPIPLIVDDCLIQFDDRRATAALELLSELAGRTQVILFTHHRHLLELAQQHLPSGGCHIHHLHLGD